jgi:predicted transposase/invertase (TIGR01784 family)
MRCKKLNEYSAFIAKVRYFEKELGNKEEAMKSAIKYCRENDILKKFLEKHSTEVFNMLITEWNTEKAKEVWFEEGMEKGIKKGIKKGIEKGREKGMEEGIELTARNALAKGISIDIVHAITGFDINVLKKF